MQASPPITPRPAGLHTRNHVLWRLKWPVFRSLKDIQVMDGFESEESEVTWTPLFGDVGNHPIGNEPVTEPPLSRMSIVCDNVHNWDYWQYGDDMEARPKPLVIENEEGKHITIAQFVESVHSYICGLRAIVNDVHGLPGESTTPFWYGQTLTWKSEEGPKKPEWVLSVVILSENSINSDHWEKLARFVRKAAKEGQTSDLTVAGFDGSGLVIAAGMSVSRFQWGDKVATIFNNIHLYGPLDITSENSGLGGAVDGILREYAMFNEETLVKLPENLSWEEGGSITYGCYGLEGALYGTRVLKPGD